MRIHWELIAPRKVEGAAIAIQFDSSAPARFRPDPLAFATPFDDTHTCIRLFYERVLAAVRRKLVPGLLGHVIVHEITHVMKRRDRHPATAMMKASRTVSGYEPMSVHPLAFEAENVEAIRKYWSGRP